VARIERTLAPFRSLPFDDAAARRYAEIRDALESRGEVIGPNDLLIAAIALTHGLILVTNNREFNRVPGLNSEDWTVA
jgi:tRNA(fMet)-specific endonuclease VapC